VQLRGGEHPEKKIRTVGIVDHRFEKKKGERNEQKKARATGQGFRKKPGLQKKKKRSEKHWK